MKTLKVIGAGVLGYIAAMFMVSVVYSAWQSTAPVDREGYSEEFTSKDWLELEESCYNELIGAVDSITATAYCYCAASKLQLLPVDRQEAAVNSLINDQSNADVDTIVEACI